MKATKLLFGILTITLAHGVGTPVQAQNGSVYFDGSTGYGNFAEEFFGGSTTTQFTLECWANQATVGTGQALWAKIGFWKDASLSLGTDGIVDFGWDDPTTETYWGVTSTSGAFSTNQWHECAVVFDGPNVTLYLDAVAVAQTTTGDGSLDWAIDSGGASQAANNICRSWNGVSQSFVNYFNGYVAEFRLWNRPLSQQEIQSKMGEILNPAAETGLVDYYVLNAGTGNTVVDLAGTNNITLQGGTIWATNSPSRSMSMSPPSFVWSKLPGITSLPANWSAAPTSIDVTNGIIYSAMNGVGWTFNMRSNSFQALPIANWPGNLGSDLWSRSVYDGANSNLYLYYGGSSYIYELPASGGSPAFLGGTGANGSEYQNMWYWNPVIRSVGRFAGYGYGAVVNWRYEFGINDSTWSQIQANVPGRGPWGRTARNYAVDPTGRRIFLFGGDGNSTGQQGYVDPGFIGNGSTTGQMDKLYDLWELNLSTGTGSWTNYIAANAYAFPWEGSIVYFPPLNAILMVNGAGIMSTNLGQPVTNLLMFRIGQDTNFIPVSMSGNIPAGSDATGNLDGCVFYDNASQQVFYFDNAGVYALSLQPSTFQPATATATIVDGFCVAATITDGGSGYTNTPLVLIQGRGGTGAAGTAVVSNGVVVGITITDAGIDYTNTPNIYIYFPNAIKVQPQSLAVNAYGTASFGVTAASTLPLNYQWSFNSTNIAGSTSNSLTISNVVPTNLGTYAVVVRNLLGTVASSNATLSMYPIIVSPFTGVVTDWGYTNILSVGAWGSGPLSYQWFDNGVAILNATNPTLGFSAIQFTNAGLYSVVVSNALGSVTNIPEQVVVNPAGVSLGLYPGVTISGVAGYNYIIQSTTNLSNTNAWVTVETLTLTQPVQLWVDTNTDTTLPANPQRYYQVLPGQ